MVSSGGDQDDQVAAINRLARKEAGALVDGGSVGISGETDAVDPKDVPVPKIELPGEGRRVTDFARECGQVMRDAGVYRRGSEVVIVDQETGLPEPLTPDKFCTAIEKVAKVIVKRKIGAGDDAVIVERLKTPTAAVAKPTLAADSFIYQLRPLARVSMVQQPIMRQDGRIELLGTGYDPASGIYTMPSKVAVTSRVEIGKLDEAGREQARIGAVGVLRSVLQEFPMESPLDMAVQAAAMLSLYGGLLLPLNANRLNFVMKANKHRSGKTLLIRLAVVPLMGKAIIQAFPRDEGDLRQVLNGAALGAKSYLILDDIRGHLISETLNGFLTASWWGDRLMHSQRQFEAMRQAVVFLSGHEFTLSPDLAGRFLECRLHVQEADSLKHRVKRPIDEAYIAQDYVRSEICSALHMLIALWDLAGRPKGSTLRPGFEEWCRVYGGIVEFAGFGDPCASRADDEGTDPEYEDMVALVKALLGTFDEGDKLKEFTFAELIEHCMELKAFQWAIDGNWKSDKDSGERWFQTSKKTESKMGTLFGPKYGGTLFEVAGRAVRFGCKGKNRNRRFTLVIES